MPRPISILLIALMCGFICTPGIAWIAGVAGGGSALENRTLRDPPAATAASLWDGSFGRGVSDWVWDRIPLRDTFLRLDHRIDAELFGDSPVFAVVAGREDFLFVREKIIQGVSPARSLRAVTAIEEAFRAAGVPFVLVISPTKADLYPELLPEDYQAIFRGTVQPLSDALEAHANKGRGLLNLWGPLRAEKARLRTATDVPSPRLRWLFRPHDLHWNLETGRVQAREIVRAIEPSLWDERYAPLLGTEIVYAESEIKRIYLKIGPDEPYRSFLPNPLVTLTRKRARLKPTGAVLRYHAVGTGEFQPDPRRLVVIRDSFLSSGDPTPVAAQDGGIQTLASFFADSAFIHLDSAIGNPSGVASELQGADVVVLQVVQANLGNLVVHHKKLVAVAGKLRKPAASATPAAPPAAAREK